MKKKCARYEHTPSYAVMPSETLKVSEWTPERFLEWLDHEQLLGLPKSFFAPGQSHQRSRAE